MKITYPKTGFSGKSLEGAMERFFSRSQDEKAQNQDPDESPANVSSKDGFIYIPTANIHFARQRTHLGKNWDETHELLKSEGLRMPTMEEFRKTLAYFRSSNEQEMQNLYKEITEVKNPWRANWIDAYFQKRDDGFYVLTGNKTKAEKLEDCLMEDKTPGINLDDWLEGKNVTSQGLPNPNMEDGKLYYWHPKDGSVARFYVSSDRADLNCFRYPSSRGSDLGVFGVMEGK